MDSQSPMVFNGDSPLHVAVRQGRLEDVRTILFQQQVDVNILNSKHETPLHLACSQTDSAIIQLLIAFGADPCIKDSNDMSTFGRSSYDIATLMNKLLFSNGFWINNPTQTNGDTPLHTAVRLGRLDDVQRITNKQIIDVNDVNVSHETPLHLACEHDHKQILHILMSNGGCLYIRDCYNNAAIHRAVSQGHTDNVNYLITDHDYAYDPKIRGYQGRTLLHYACGVGNVDLVNILIEKHGISPMAADAVNQTPLHVAASHGQEEIVCLLITKYNCPVDCRSNYKLTPLHLASYCGHVSVANLLVFKYKADVNALDESGGTPFLKAAMGGNIELVEIMITDFDIDPLSATDDSGETPLHMACQYGHEELARLLITKYNCQVDAISKNKQTSLHTACLSGHSPVVRMLVSEFKANLMARDHENDLPVNKAALDGHTDTVQMLIAEFGCCPQSKGFEGRSLLHQACSEGHIKLAMSLIADYDLDPLSVDDNGDTPLHMACMCGHEELARLLITKYNCPVDIINKNKLTPLHRGCLSGHSPVVRMLVSEFKANLMERDHENDTPVNKAALGGHADTVQMLITEFGCDPQIKGFEGRSLLHQACYQGHVNLAIILITNFNLDPLLVDNRGNTPLHMACMCGHEELARLLTEYNCPVGIKNKDKQIPLHFACAYGHVGVAKLLATEHNSRLGDDGRFSMVCNTQDKDSNTPLDLLIKKGDTKAVHSLSTEYGFKLHIKGAESKSLLHQLAAGGFATMIQELVLNFNHDPASVDKDGNTTLHTAALFGKRKVVELLITIHCPIDYRNFQGHTPLHCACIRGHAGVAELLIRKGALVYIRDKDGDSPLKKAYLTKNTDVLGSVLQSLGYDSTNIDSKLLHQVCEHGSVESADMLLTEFNLDPSSVLDEQGNTPLHIAALYGHKEMVLLLINKYNCSINCKNTKGQAPLHLICNQRFSDPIENLIKLFILECGADVTIRDNNGDQPIHVLAQAGCTNVMNALIADYGCDPYSRGFKNQTLLHQALAKGHTSTAKALIEVFNLSVHSTDDDGNTPLHFSALSGHTESVKLLLYYYHVPIFVRNKAGKTALDLANTNPINWAIINDYTRSEHKNIQAEYKELWSLSSQKYSGQHNITRVFVLGNPGSGKSTLIESLKRKGIISSFFLVSKADVPPHTAGIIPSVYQSKGTGHLLYYDFAGDKEYYSSHSAILEVVSHSNVGNSVFVIVTNMTNDNGTLCSELGYWLSFISYHAKIMDSHDKLNLIIVLSHSDLLTSSNSANKLDIIKYYLQNISDQLSQWSLNVLDILSLNCRRPSSSKVVVDSIVQLSKCISPYSLSTEAALLHGALLQEKDFRNVIACKFHVLLGHIKDTGVCLPNEAYALYPMVKELHDIGLLMMIGQSEDQIENYLLLMDIPSLTNEVHQILFHKLAEKNNSSAISSQYAKMGIFPESFISRILPDHITKECLVQLQYCQEFSHAEVGLDYSVTQNSESTNLLLYFPSLCQLESEHANWSHDPDLNFSIGWFVKCIGKLDYFPPRYLHVLLLRLTFMFALPASTTPISDVDLNVSLCLKDQNCHCTMWKNGIHWLTREGVECIVEVVNENKGVVVVVKSRKQHTYQCIHMLTQIVNVITEAKTEFCNSVSLQRYILNSDDLASYNNEDKLYDVNLIKTAMENKDEVVISASGCQTFTLENLKLLKCHTYWGEFSSCH